MIKNIVYCIIISLLILSCKDSSQDDGKRNKFEIKTNSIHIKTDTLAKYNYDLFTIKNKKDLELITYNNTSHSIEFFNLTTKILSKRIFLKSEGPKAIGDVTGLYYHNQDSIFIATRGSIKIIQESYDKEANPNLLAFIENYELNYGPRFNHHFRLYYIPELKSIPVYNSYFDPKNKISSQTEQISLFDLSNFKIKPLKYFQTEPIKSDIEYGFLNNATISRPVDGDFFVNQVYSPRTFKYNARSKTVKEVIGIDKIYHKENKNPDNGSIHAIESNFYNQLQNLNDEQFVRIVWEESDHVPNENGFLKKEYILQIFDPAFNLIDEIKLPKNTYSAYSWFVGNGKIYLQVGHPLFEHVSEEELIIHELVLIEENGL